MKLIRQSHNIWGITPTDITEQFKWIERAGRVCWKSEDKITDDSYIKFTYMIINKGHMSVLEHSNIIHLANADECCGKYSVENFDLGSSNLRVIANQYGCDGLSDLEEVCRAISIDADVPNCLQRITVEFNTNRAVTHELVRHRVASFSQSSQRYIRYGNDMEFIEPWYWPTLPDCARIVFLESLIDAENGYTALRDLQLTPQDARHVLPNATATTLIMTAYLPDWCDIFRLRCSPAADPQMVALMVPVRNEFMKRGWL